MTFERKDWKGADDVLLVPISDIAIPEGIAEADPDPVLVQNIADTIQTFGLIHPIAVRQQLFAFGKRHSCRH
jgi:ParB-like chromosome segregation protein Spo0J